MNVAQVTAEILRREGVEVLLTYPLNPLTETAAEVNIRPIVVRRSASACTWRIASRA